VAKRVKHEEHEEGEAWLMSYADLVTLLLAIFVLLFSLSSVDNQKISQVTRAISTYLNTRKTDVGNSVGDVSLEERQLLAYRKLAAFLDLGHPDEVLARLDKIQESPEEIRKLLALAERMGLYGNAKMNQQALRYEVVIPIEMAFEKNGPYLSAKGLEVLKAVAPRLRESLKDPRRYLEIAGHTDGGPLPASSEFSSPQILSAARAEAASLTLQQLGLDGARIQIVGKGATEPLYPELDSRGVQVPSVAEKNRRLVLTLYTESTLTSHGAPAGTAPSGLAKSPPDKVAPPKSTEKSREIFIDALPPGEAKSQENAPQSAPESAP
jgi:chemotaxis protein MotB